MRSTKGVTIGKPLVIWCGFSDGVPHICWHEAFGHQVRVLEVGSRKEMRSLYQDVRKVRIQEVSRGKG